MKRVITYGTFDLLHYGHINLLRRAKQLGDYLIVALSTDEFNWEEKHKKCYFSYEKRKQLLEAIRYVDLVIPDNRAVSRSHADILCQEDGYYVRDNNSTNHTYLNGQAVSPGQLVRLEDGARLRLADEDFEVHLA